MQLTQLQRSGATYCDEPAEKEQYAAFLDSYDEEARRAEAEQTLASNSFMADLHSRLVPLVISDDTFWQRYFFRCCLLPNCSLQPCPFCLSSLSKAVNAHCQKAMQAVRNTPSTLHQRTMHPTFPGQVFAVCIVRSYKESSYTPRRQQ